LLRDRPRNIGPEPAGVGVVHGCFKIVLTVI
jgi:hypothetical protein